LLITHGVDDKCRGKVDEVTDKFIGMLRFDVVAAENFVGEIA
jgi:hypothetical protein